MKHLVLFAIAIAGSACAVAVQPVDDGSYDAGPSKSAQKDSGSSNNNAPSQSDASSPDPTPSNTPADQDSGSSGGGVDCSGYADPNTSAACHACTSSKPSCQPNGCYGGYYCDLSATKCVAPPNGC